MRWAVLYILAASALKLLLGPQGRGDGVLGEEGCGEHINPKSSLKTRMHDAISTMISHVTGRPQAYDGSDGESVRPAHVCTVGSQNL